MSNTGYSWSAYSATYNDTQSGDWTTAELLNTEVDYSTFIDCSGYAAIMFGIAIDEPDNDSPHADGLNIYILHDVDGTNPEDVTNSGAFAFNIAAAQNSTVYKAFALSCAEFDRIKIAIHNDCDVNVNVTVKHKLASIPLAS